LATVRPDTNFTKVPRKLNIPASIAGSSLVLSHL